MVEEGNIIPPWFSGSRFPPFLEELNEQGQMSFPKQTYSLKDVEVTPSLGEY